MAKGAIVRIVHKQGFGFIRHADSRTEVVFLKSAVSGTSFDELNEGQRVEFEFEPDPGEPTRSRAARVRRLS